MTNEPNRQAPGVKVKALVWRGTDGVLAKADALFGATYRITDYVGMSKPFKLETVGFVGPSGHYEFLDDAKVAAQAHFDGLVLSALEPVAVQPGELDRKALVAARRAYQSAIPEMFHADGGESDKPIEAAVRAYLSALVPSAPAPVEEVEPMTYAVMGFHHHPVRYADTLEEAEREVKKDVERYVVPLYSASAISRLVQERDAAEKQRLSVWRDWQKIRDAVLKPSPMCRDCADENGTCPTSGLPCDITDRIVEVHRRTEASVARLTALLAEADAVIHNIHVRTVGWRNVLDLADLILPFLNRYQQKREAK